MRGGEDLIPCDIQLVRRRVGIWVTAIFVTEVAFFDGLPAFRRMRLENIRLIQHEHRRLREIVQEAVHCSIDGWGMPFGIWRERRERVWSVISADQFAGRQHPGLFDLVGRLLGSGIEEPK